MAGTSWANAASGSMVHAILLSATSGDRVYFSEGDYTTDRVLVLPSGVSLFGGFPSENPSWETRNAFTHQTVWTASHSGAWLASTSDITGQLVDGFTLMNYAGTTADGSNLTFKNMTLSGGSFTTAGDLENCYVTGVTLNAANVTSCEVVNSPAVISKAKNTYFYYASVEVSRNAEDCNVYGTEESKVNCCFSGPATNCTAVNCTADTYTFKSYATNCTAMNCAAEIPIFYGIATNCTAVNCAVINANPILSEGIFAYSSTNCTAVNCTVKSGGSYIFGGPATNCTAMNCTVVNSLPGNGRIFGNATAQKVNCTAVNCTVEDGSIFDNDSSQSTVNCTAVNCICSEYIFRTTSSVGILNCLSWNNSGTEFSDYTELTTCAGSVYNVELALTLGTDNTIARFTNTGFAPAQGVQDVGDCPSPIDDPDGYAEWLAAFGDWHPASNSFLLGAGTADSSVTTDADGVTRPDPPSIGAYEAKPAQETAE